jgi:hypothetical protein
MESFHGDCNRLRSKEDMVEDLEINEGLMKVLNEKH